LRRRWGYSSFATVSGVKRLYKYQNDARLERRIIAVNPTTVDAIDEQGNLIGTVLTPAEGSDGPRMVTSRDYAFFTDGVSAPVKWNGVSEVTACGMDAPTTAITVGTPISGNITLSLGGRAYYCVFKSTSGHYSDLSPISATTGNVTGKSIPLNLPVSAQAGVTRKTVLATADSGDPSTLYEVVELPNETLGYTDDTDEETLLTRNTFLETYDDGTEVGVTDNTPPPNGRYLIKHKGRLFMMVGQYLRCSKSLSDIVTSTGKICGRYEEAWPVDYELDISEGAETARGLLSDGEVLYIGTERHIRRVYGDGPQNFQKPEVAFNEVGIVNQDVWKVVFLEGTPAGAMWLTPDRRVIASDFNTYMDVGTPLQDILESVNLAAIDTCHATYFSSGRYALYTLFLPTGSSTTPDTVCVYSLTDKRWYVWKFADNFTASLFNVMANGATQLILADSNGTLYKLDPTATTDNGTAIRSTARTVWLHVGEPSARKLLNELEVMTQDNAAMRITIQGASNASEFETPTAVITNGQLQTGVFGELKLYLAGYTANDRYYRLTFDSTSNVDSFSMPSVWKASLPIGSNAS
jgi:hypothetical protein